MNKLKAWIVATRPFALPWIAVNTLLGSALAGFDVKMWFAAFAIVSLVLIAGHFINNWRDYVRGFDKLEEGSRSKIYTSANQLLPSGILTVEDMQGATIITLATATVLMFAVAKRVDSWLLYLLGIFCAATYTDFWKVKGLGEIPLFLGHGFGASTFAYSLVKPVDFAAISIGFLLGMWAGIIYTLDQYKDVETDFAKKAKDLAYIMFRAGVKPSAYLWFAGSATSTLAVALVLAGILPREILTALISLPAVHISGIVIDYDFDKGVLLALISMWIYALFPAVALLL